MKELEKAIEELEKENNKIEKAQNRMKQLTQRINKLKRNLNQLFFRTLFDNSSVAGSRSCYCKIYIKAQEAALVCFQ